MSPMSSLGRMPPIIIRRTRRASRPRAS
jgi:hypothetical protein